MRDHTWVANVLERMKTAFRVNKLEELAARLGVSRQAVYNAKSKRKLPSEWLLIAADATGVSMDWLVYGEGSMWREEKPAPPVSAPAVSFTEDLVHDVVQTVAEILLEQNRRLEPEAMADLVREMCRLVLEEEASCKGQAAMFRLIHGALAAHG